MIAAANGPVSYAGLLERARHLLAPLGLTEFHAPAAWTVGGGVDRLCRLTAAVWELGSGRAGLAQCRAVKLTGPFADAFITVIHPTDPASLPAFTAELYAGAGHPALAYLDLPAPGLRVSLRNAVAEQTTVLSIRHAPFLPRDEAPPAWVLDDSPGGFLFTRTTDAEALARLAQAFEDYLNVWIDFAFPHVSAEFARSANPAPVEQKKRFDLHAPTRALLEQYFGPEWADRFIGEF